MKFTSKIAALLLFAIAVLSSASASAISRDEYVAKVMDIFRMQADLLREMAATPRFKYSDNLVRNALALERTFGLLGPMEWHAMESATIYSEYQQSGTDMDERKFEELAFASRRAFKNVIRTAHDVMEVQDRNSLVIAIDEMQASCTDCHRLLPKSVAPDLWGPLQQEQ